jgi:excisionase family DNA binding protein
MKKADSKLVTYAEASDFLRVSKATIYNLLDSGKLRRIVIGGHPFLHRDEIERLIARQLKGKPTPPLPQRQRATLAGLKARGIEPKRPLAV